jgi:phenylalanyl-tRNA synthetase beta chain
MSIHLNDKEIGFLGYLSDKTMHVFEKGTQVVWFELDVDALNGPTYPSVSYETIPIYPGSWMDFTILVDRSLSYNELHTILKQFAHPIVRKFKFLYLYDGKGLPEGKASYTFRFWLGSNERTLTGDDLAVFHSTFLTFLEYHKLGLR